MFKLARHKLYMYMIKKILRYSAVQLTALKLSHTGHRYWSNELDVLQVLELRLVESQILHEEAPSEQGSSTVEPCRHNGASVHGGTGNTDTSPVYNFNLSFEELSNVGLDEPPRHANPTWMVSISQVLAILFSSHSILDICFNISCPL